MCFQKFLAGTVLSSRTIYYFSALSMSGPVNGFNFQQESKESHMDMTRKARDIALNNFEHS